LAKIFAFWTKNTVNSEEQNNHSITFQEKRWFFLRKFIKITENNDYNSTPWTPNKSICLLRQAFTSYLR
jgi:hypothetical protein